MDYHELIIPTLLLRETEILLISPISIAIAPLLLFIFCLHATLFPSLSSLCNIYIHIYFSQGIIFCIYICSSVFLISKSIDF